MAGALLDCLAEIMAPIVVVDPTESLAISIAIEPPVQSLLAIHLRRCNAQVDFNWQHAAHAPPVPMGIGNSRQRYVQPVSRADQRAKSMDSAGPAAVSHRTHPVAVSVARKCSAQRPSPTADSATAATDRGEANWSCALLAGQFSSLHRATAIYAQERRSALARRQVV